MTINTMLIIGIVIEIFWILIESIDREVKNA